MNVAKKEVGRRVIRARDRARELDGRMPCPQRGTIVAVGYDDFANPCSTVHWDGAGEQLCDNRDLRLVQRRVRATGGHRATQRKPRVPVPTPGGSSRMSRDVIRREP